MSRKPTDPNQKQHELVEHLFIELFSERKPLPTHLRFLIIQK